MKRLISMLMAGFMVMALTACGSNTDEKTSDKSGGKAEFTMKVGHTLQEGTPPGIAWEKFKKEVETNSKGRIKVELYPNSSLGSERVMFESCQMGSLEVAYGTTSVLANFDKNFEVLDLPFLFSNEKAARKAMTGELGKKVASGLDKINLSLLTYMENGIRHVTNNARPIVVPDDLKGLKIRTMENSIHMSAFKHMGASPTPMAFTELFTALQQKTVDGEENPIFLIKSSRFEEVQKYLSLTSHFYTSGIATVNKDFWNKLPDDLKKIVQTAANNARDEEYKLCDKQNAEALEFLKKAMTVNAVTPDNHKLFVEATAPVYKEVEGQQPADLMKVVYAARGSAK